MPETDLSFGMWVDQNVERKKKLPCDKRFGETLILPDPDGKQSACIKVEEVPSSVSVIIPQQAGQWELFDPGPNGWRKRCDYILMGETEDCYFALLIELKTSVPNADGVLQLKWSLPIFHYLLSTYCIDKHASVWEKGTKVKYFQVGTNLHEPDKDLTRIDESIFFEKVEEDKIEILYSDSDLFSLDLLLKAGA